MWISITECEGHEKFDNDAKFLDTQQPKINSKLNVWGVSGSSHR